MLKRIIPILEIATTVAAIGLVAFQLFWISESKKTKEEWFNITANKVMDEVIATMEKDELVFHLVNSNPQQGYTFSKTKFNIQSQRKDQQVFTVDILAPESNSQLPIKDPTMLQMLYSTLDEIDKQQQLDDSTSERSSIKKVSVNNIVTHIVSVEAPMQQRISKEKINTLLAASLKNYGLNLNFSYAIHSDDGQFLFGSDKPLTGDAFARQLFPSDAISEHYTLSVNFPNRDSFIYKTMGATIFVSLALLIVVLTVFYGTLAAVFRQKKLSQMRSDFVSNMTHEFKTPITTIILASEMMKDKAATNDTENHTHLMQMITAQAKKLSLLVEQSLQLALFENNKTRLKLKELDAHGVINRVVDVFLLQTTAKKTQLITHIDAEQSYILANELHFSNIVSNLIDNALKYSKTDPVITVSTRNTATDFVLQVSDNGIGIAADDQKHVFEQFYRVHTGNLHDVKGFGLGLSYVKKIVEAHKGTISVESKLGKGSTFIVSIPTYQRTANK